MKIPAHLKFLETQYLPNNVCQKRLKEFFFDEYKDVQGVRFDGKPSDQLVGGLNLMKEPGDSMLCSSMCVEEDLTRCVHEGIHPHEGTCAGDSGGNLHNK